ncbi:LON peptidase N-terminal domain and RING finger protein [Lachnellula suecica]|uniref:LON peptidase N-terminal domain and RING finger protein n=1 Tax=Lachnellula suecica TaxID=602035 RepID=A0A8T9CCD3_9HELO|nr:LON peptidase N-terminal domain and RING finger protein [Lachnellula suecica]
MTVVREEVERYRNTTEASDALLQVEERDKWSIAGVSSLRDEEVRIRVLHGGRLASTYAMAEMGELAHDSEVTYTPTSPGSASEILDNGLLHHLKETTRAEMDCQVCYGLFLEPLTTACGHTFCRQCVHRVLDHSNICPICRRVLSLPPATNTQQSPSNILLTKLLNGLCPEAMAERAEMAKAEYAGLGELDTPLFICTLGYPSVTTFLHVFEPRYRLMIRRAIESGGRKFGVLLPNPRREPQGDLGPVPFYQYGTLLDIVDMRFLRDGRSYIQTVGVSRFRVLKHGTLDGYAVGKIERVDDISVAQEEALEAAEMSALLRTRNLSAQDHFDAPPHHVSTQDTSREPAAHDVDSMSTQDLFAAGVAFVKKKRHETAAWLSSQVLLAYGEMPEDPVLFPWWFAAVLPLHEELKYKLIESRSVRERLKICVQLLDQVAREEQRYATFFGCLH